MRQLGDRLDNQHRTQLALDLLLWVVWNGRRHLDRKFGGDAANVSYHAQLGMQIGCENACLLAFSKRLAIWTNAVESGNWRGVFPVEPNELDSD